MNLLLIDESLKYCHQLEKLFAEAKFSINANFSTSVEKAINQLEMQNFDLVLLSDQIEHWKGTDLLVEIKVNLKSPKTAILMLSDQYCDGHVLDCIQAGAHGLLLKSELNPTRLHHAIIQAKARCALELKLHQSYGKVKYLAEHDSLTGVGNRYMFDMMLLNAVEESRAKKLCVGLVLVNIERFKLLNDTYGHDIGDMILKHLTDSINKLLKPNEHLFRLGGDEFAILLTELAYAHIDDIGQRILYELEIPFKYNGHNIKLNVNMGTAFCPQNASNAQELLRSADIAEHCARDIGSNTICFVDDDIQDRFHERYRIENSLRQAIDRNELTLHYQPVVSAKSDRLVSCEALVRWQHPEHGLMFPDYFIAIAEETGLIVEMGRWIINEALAQLSLWQSRLNNTLVMALNISPQQLYDKQLVSYLDSKLNEYGLSPSQVEIEITETVLLKNTTDVTKTLSALSSRGYKIALDDFGTGFSSIQHLHTFPISTVKIDRSLMPNPNSSKKSLSLLEGLVSMLSSMQLSIVAEGIEILDNVHLCKKLGVDRLQGYYFSKPISGNEFLQHKLCITKNNNENNNTAFKA